MTSLSAFDGLFFLYQKFGTALTSILPVERDPLVDAPGIVEAAVLAKDVVEAEAGGDLAEGLAAALGPGAERAQHPAWLTSSSATSQGWYSVLVASGVLWH